MGQWGIGIDAEPFLSYSGNLIGGVTEVPSWTGSEGLIDGIDFYRYREEKDDWIRYRLATHIAISTDKNVVALLDDDLVEIGISKGIERHRSYETDISLGIEKEKWHGDGRLKRIWSRGGAVSIKQRSFESSTVNPLEAYLSDTLWYRSGFSVGFSLFQSAGLGYFITNSLRISGKVSYGLSASNLASGRLRKVEMVGDSAELIQYRTESSRTNWSVDTFILPQLTLTFYFDGQFF